MTLAARTPGAWAEGTTSVTPALPAASAVGDMMVLFVGAKPYNCTIGTPAGWTAIHAQQTNGSTASSVDDGSVTWRSFYRIKESGDGDPAVTVTSGNVTLAVVHAYSKTKAVWKAPTAYHGSDTSSGSNLNLTFSSSSGALTSGDELISCMVLPTDTPNPASPAISATSATIGTVTESPSTDGSSTNGDDLRASTATASVTAGTSSADATGSWAFLTTTTGGGALIRLREVDGQIFHVIYPSGESDPSAAQVKAGQRSSGAAAVASGGGDVTSSTQTYTFSAATGLTIATSYKVAFVWSNGTNDSSVLVSSAWATNNTGTVAVTESGSDTAAFNGGALLEGTLAATEGADTASFAGDVYITGTLAVTSSGSDTAAIAGDVYISGTLTATESGDTASFAGDVPRTGTLAATEGADTAAIFGTTTGALQGTLAATESGGDTAQFGQNGVIVDPGGIELDTIWTPAAAVDTTWTEVGAKSTNWTREVRI